MKIMPTCIPLTARICDAPARENSFFIVDVNSDLSAMQRALHMAEVSALKCVENISDIEVLVLLARFSIIFRFCFEGFSMQTEK